MSSEIVSLDNFVQLLDIATQIGVVSVSKAVGRLSESDSEFFAMESSKRSNEPDDQRLPGISQPIQRTSDSERAGL
jgi:hypothetical protein